jgi:hypothetical protein
MSKLEITEELAQAILNYLANRPYKKVMVLIDQLMQLKKIEEPKEPAKE